jgi:hypothetical protein
MRLLATALAALAVLSTSAHAAEKTMSVDFVGDWCSAQEDYASKPNELFFRLPSWTRDRPCTDILSIKKYGFYFSATNDNCDPVSVQYTKDVAPSGTAYIATVTARCQPSGQVTATSGKLKTFKFTRYKGNLDITVK